MTEYTRVFAIEHRDEYTGRWRVGGSPIIYLTREVCEAEVEVINAIDADYLEKARIRNGLTPTRVEVPDRARLIELVAVR